MNPSRQGLLQAKQSIMTIHATFNFWEGWFWIVLSVGTLATTITKQKRIGWFSVGLFVLLVLFGLSDFVEMRTGAWYKPWWLFVWKAFCVVGFVLMWFAYRKRK